MCHSFHLCIISNNNSELLEKTLTSTRKILPKFRSILVFKNKKNSVSKYKSLIQLESLKMINIPLNIMNDIEKGLNVVFNLLRKRGIYKILLLFEGEIIASQHPVCHWEKEYDNELIKIYNPNQKSFIWHPRVLHLKTNILCSYDKNYYPLIQLESKKLFKTSYNWYILNTPFSNIYYSSCKALDKASQYIYKGQLNKSHQLLKSVHNKSFNKELKSRSYLLIAYCLMLKNYKFHKLSKLLELSYNISGNCILEPLYLLLIIGIKQEKYTEVIEVIEKYRESFYIESPPHHFVLNYKLSIYQYVFLYLVYIVAYKNKNFSLLYEILSILLEKTNLPNDIKSELIRVLENVKLKLEFNTSLQYYLNSKQNISSNIKLVLEKPDLIPIYLGKTSPKYLEYNIGNSQLIYNNILFGLESSRRKSGERIEIIHKNSIYSYFKVWNKYNNLFISRPFLFVSNNIKLYTSNFNKQYLVCALQEYYRFSYPYKQLNSPYQKLSKICIYHGYGNISDYLNIMMCFLMGCVVFYHGHHQIYLDFTETFGEYIVDITNMTEGEIDELVLLYKYKDIAIRKMIQDAFSLTFFEIYQSSIKNIPFTIFHNSNVKSLVESNEINEGEFPKELNNVSSLLWITEGFINSYLLQKINSLVSQLQPYQNIVFLNHQQLIEPILDIKLSLNSKNIRWCKDNTNKNSSIRYFHSPYYLHRYQKHPESCEIFSLNIVV